MTKQDDPVLLTEEQLDEIIGGVTNAMNGAVPGAGQLNVAGMDIETALMMVQGERTRLLDEALKAQIGEVQNRNARVADLNEGLAFLNHTRDSAQRDHGTVDVDQKVMFRDQETTVGEVAKQFGVSDAALADGVLSVSELEQGISNTKSGIDSATNSQQMDMLRLQSMSNKRNEAFEVMTNFVKKMQESRSSIIGNMR
jgi:hypothetical protein